MNEGVRDRHCADVRPNDRSQPPCGGLGEMEAEFLSQFPLALQSDERMRTMAVVIARALELRWQEAELGSVYPNIDQLPEPLLDILAHDFKVEWWDADYGVEEKRRLLKSSWQVHRMLGTKAAVEKAASAVYPYATVQEWFEYGGEPYHFRLNVDLPEDIWTPERHKRLMRQMEYYKNLRSHLDSVTYQLPPVILENRQALWFAVMRILLGQEHRELLALERLRLVMGMRQRQGQTVGLHVRSGVKSREAFSLYSLLIRVRMNNYGLDPIRLNGSRKLDGTWRLGQIVARPPALHAITVAGMGAKNRQSASAAVTEDTMWRLDGTWRLDGRKKLNAAIRRSEL